MHYERYKMKKEKLLVIFNLILIPFCSYLFVLKGDIYKDTLSTIGSSKENQIYLIIWGICICIFFGFCINDLMKRFAIKSKLIKVFMVISCLFLILTVCIPYLPDTKPTIANIHLICAYFGILLIIITLYVFAFIIKNSYKSIYKKIILYLNILVISCILLYFLTMSSGFLEIVIVDGMSVLLYLITIWHRKYLLIKNTKIIF